MTRQRAYGIALALSLALNVVLIAAFTLYLHFEGLLSIVEEVVGFLG